MEPITTFTARMLALENENIDTDQIIPARFLKITDKAALGQYLFNDWRYDAAGNPRPDFILNRPDAAGRQVLVAGNNFGCGSSREHAPWALRGYGFRAVISTSFADIFFNNALKNGLLPIALEPDAHRRVMAAALNDPQAEITIDLAHQRVTLNDGRSFEFPIDAFSKYCLLNGVDELGYLLSHDADISSYEKAHDGWAT